LLFPLGGRRGDFYFTILAGYGEDITAQNIKEVYGAEDCVYTHPVNGLPVVLLDGNSRQPAKPGGGVA